MPELPEVETIKIGLEKKIIDKKIKKIFRSDKKLRFNSNLDLKLIEKNKINKISRKARYLLIEISEKYILVIHLGMSGRLTFLQSDSGLKNYEIQKHDHFICEFENGDILSFNDPRRFGFVDLVAKNDINQYKLLSKLGPEPLSTDFNESYLYQKLKNKSKNIKTTMMDNEIVVGVGNIYINESLFLSQILPTRHANSLTKKEIIKLVATIKEILQKAIESKGSSINDYVDESGNLGNFQNNFKIYGLEKKNCVKCNMIIKRIIQNQRSTFYCETCQK